MSSFFKHKPFWIFLYILIILTVIILVSCKQTDITAKVEFINDAPKEVQEAAIQGLIPFLHAIPENELALYNFSNKEEFNYASLGKPLRVYTIKPEEIINYEGNKSILEIVSATSVWLFPVVVNNEFRTLLTVDLIDNSWEATAIGSSGLAEQLSYMYKKWPSSEGYKHIFVRVFQATSEFVILLHSGKIEIKPLNSAIISLKLEEGKMIDPTDMILKLKRPVFENINSNK